MAFLYSLISLLTAMAGIALGTFIFARNPKRPLNKLYMLMCLSASYACAVEFGYFYATSSEAADWLRHADVVWPFVLPLIIHFGFTGLTHRPWTSPCGTDTGLKVLPPSTDFSNGAFST